MIYYFQTIKIIDDDQSNKKSAFFQIVSILIVMKPLGIGIGSDLVKIAMLSCNVKL